MFNLDRADLYIIRKQNSIHCKVTEYLYYDLIHFESVVAQAMVVQFLSASYLWVSGRDTNQMALTQLEFCISKQEAQTITVKISKL